MNLVDAIHSEAAATQNTIPPAIGFDLLAGKAEIYAEWLAGQLEQGLVVTQSPVVAAKKFPHGTRPVPVLGPSERIVYRAVTELILRNSIELDRSPQAYFTFVAGPLEYSKSVGWINQNQHFSIDPNEKYVVKSDIVSFYDYVDHGLLGEELVSLEGDFEAVRCLVDLLREVQGRGFGLPQMLDASDRLAEVYIDQVERQLIRRGWPVWRFNDDFRIVAEGYSEAQGAIDDLASAAREYGLTVSDFKTTTPKLSTYFADTFELEVDETLAERLEQIDPEFLVGSYAEGVGGEMREGDRAAQTLEQVQVTPSDDPEVVSLSSLGHKEYRLLRRALTWLSVAPGDEIPDSLALVLAFVPSLMPWAMRLVAATRADSGQARRLVVDLATKLHLDDWQRSWLVRTICDLDLLSEDDDDGQALRDWVEGLSTKSPSPVVIAESVRTLASANLVGIAELSVYLQDLPHALTPFVFDSVRSLRSCGTISEAELRAFSTSGSFSKILLGDDES